MIRERAVDAIVEERHRQNKLKADGKFAYTCADVIVGEHRITSADKLAILAEEFGEVARAVCEGDRVNLREELTQVAAVCLAWLEAL